MSLPLLRRLVCPDAPTTKQSSFFIRKFEFPNRLFEQGRAKLISRNVAPLQVAGSLKFGSRVQHSGVKVSFDFSDMHGNGNCAPMIVKQYSGSWLQLDRQVLHLV